MNFHKRVVFGPVSGGARQGYVSLKDGIVRGPKLNGTLMEYSGADWGVLRQDGVLEANAHYMLEADDGTPIYIHNRGYIYNTQPNSPGPAYFRCTPYFRAPVGKHDWLNRTSSSAAASATRIRITRSSVITRSSDRRPMKRIDYIVVGGGSAGCVVAARLSEDPSVNVLLLEAGDDERKFFRIRMPLAWRDAFLDPRLSWGFETEPEPHADGRRVPAPRGKVLGGSNSVNGLMYMRGCPADYDDWAKRGLPGWDYAGVLPYFRRSETQLARRLALSRRHRSADDRALRNRRLHLSAHHRNRRDAGLQAPRGFSRRGYRGFLGAGHQLPRRRAREHRGALPAPGDVAAEPAGAHQHARAFAAARERPLRRRARGIGGAGRRHSLRARGDPLGGHVQFAAAAAALGHRRAARISSRMASACGTRCRASARICRITSR